MGCSTRAYTALWTPLSLLFSGFARSVAGYMGIEDEGRAEDASLERWGELTLWRIVMHCYLDCIRLDLLS